jgi:hypothetical protein
MSDHIPDAGKMVICEESVIQLRISSMAHAFDDEGRKYAVRLLARDVAAIESERDQLRVRVEQLETYANKLEIAGDTLATVTIRNGRSHDQWHDSKLGKPEGLR